MVNEASPAALMTTEAEPGAVASNWIDRLPSPTGSASFARAAVKLIADPPSGGAMPPRVVQPLAVGQVVVVQVLRRVRNASCHHS
ncbi:MAG: hypothetical protein KatS3mg105_5221 [Gemmatales bacterium]|nr:MAG: hypothetical protein KatS3mg105_5221 [Gemmatales bacterium]